MNSDASMHGSAPHLIVLTSETGCHSSSQIRGVNGTLIANQYVRADATQPADTKRTLITLDNGGNWELVVPPDRYSDGTTVNCDPPQCSLHLHMDSTSYARLGVYSRVSGYTAHTKCMVTAVSPPGQCTRTHHSSWDDWESVE